MSAALQPPLLAPDRAAKLLEEVIYARVRDCVDLEDLLAIEHDLRATLLGHCGASHATAKREARALVDDALTRLTLDDERYASLPYGGECELCEEEARAVATQRLRTS